MVKDISVQEVINIYTLRNRILQYMEIYQSEEEENFHIWLNKFEYLSYSFGIPILRKNFLFVKMISNDVNDRIQEMTPNVNIKILSYDQLITLYAKNLLSITELNMHRQRFLIRKQFRNESIECFANCLKFIINKCNARLIDRRLRRQFINGLLEDDTRNYLQENINKLLSLREMVELTIEYEKKHLLSYYLNKLLFDIGKYNVNEEIIFYDWLNGFEYAVEDFQLPEYMIISLFFKMIDYNVNEAVIKANPSVDFVKLKYENLLEYYYRYLFPNSNDFNIRRVSLRFQYRYETIIKYANHLRKMLNMSDYTERVDKYLCEQFYAGLREPLITDYLDKIPRPWFDKTVNLANEFAKKNLISYYLNLVLIKVSPLVLEDKGEFHFWLNKFEYVANAIEVPDNKMGQLFIQIMHIDVREFVEISYHYLRLNELSYDDLLDNCIILFANCRGNFNRLRFTCRNQYEDETVERYANSLRKLFNKCHYRSYLHDKLCKKFINGLRDVNLKNSLNKIIFTSYDDMVEKAISYEKLNPLNYYVNCALLKIDIYNPQCDGWFYLWLNKFEYIAYRMKVSNDLMIEFFSKMVLNNVHSAVRKKNSTVNFSEITYDKLINHYLRYFSPNDVDLHKLRYMSRKQYEDEPIEQYIDNLQKIFNKCNDNYIKRVKHLCGKFIHGLREQKLKDYLKPLFSCSYHKITTSAIDFAKKHLITYYSDRVLLKMDTFHSRYGCEFYLWLNKFECVIDMIEIPIKEVLVKLFNKMIHNDVHVIVREAYPDVTFSSLMYQPLVNKYLSHFSPHNDNPHNIRFLCRNQYENEPIDIYGNSLIKIIALCTEHTNDLSNILCSRLLMGLRENKLIDCLLENICSYLDMLKCAYNYGENNLLTFYTDRAILKMNILTNTSDIKFYNWLNRFEFVMNVIKVPDNKMIDIFFSMIDNDVHIDVKRTYSIDSFSNLSYDAITKIYHRYFCKINIIDLNVRRFLARNQYEDEPLSDFANNLKQIHAKCEFKSKSKVEYILYLRFINGMRDRNLSREFSSLGFKNMDHLLVFHLLE